MNVFRYLRSFLVVSIAALLLQPLASAADFGAITGIVKDAARVPMAGVTITATKQDGGGVRSTISNSEGVYSFADVVPGTWAITAQTDGHPDFTISSLVVVAGRGTRADLALTLVAAPAVPSPAVAATPVPAVSGRNGTSFPNV